jgi:hypothetical protein
LERDLQYHPGKPATARNLAQDAMEAADDIITDPIDAPQSFRWRLGQYIGRGGADINTPVEEDPAIRQQRKRSINFPEPL